MDNRALITILRCAEETDGQVGRSGMLKILTGQDSKKLSKLKFDHLDEYGSLSWMGKKIVLEHIDYLIEHGCLTLNSFLFPMIIITDVGTERIKQMIRFHGLRILPEKPVNPKPERELEDIYVCNENEFWDVFLQDLNSARYEVIIVSPFVARNRLETLLKDFEVLLNRGASIRLYVRPPDDYGANLEEKIMALDTLEAIGAEVIRREKIHYKAAIIDRATAWEGSLNILQHWNSKEQMTRHEDPKYIKQLLDVLDLG